MAISEAIKEAVKPPFANYDIVVYFGGGLFALPLINHYFVEPSSFRFPRFTFDIGYAFANDAISLLSLLFSVYLLGHIISYCSSLVIERAINEFNGKVSSAILISSYSGRANHDELVNSWIYGRLGIAFRKGRRFQNGLRLFAHLPAIPLYLLIDVTGGYDYFRSRIPRHIVYLAKKRFVEDGLGTISLNSQWYKTLEHWVINNNPLATGRMYNYLVISGLFRSLSFMFLACLWGELYYLTYLYLIGSTPLKALMSDGSGLLARSLGVILLYVAYAFSHSSYMKFQRRYAEEAIFAYVLARR